MMDLLPARSTLENSTAPGNLRLTDMPAARATARTLERTFSAPAAKVRRCCSPIPIGSQVFSRKGTWGGLVELLESEARGF